jgi:peptidoglycan hydrolase-like protein with peptidoglycan-binding domain
VTFSFDQLQQQATDVAGMAPGGLFDDATDPGIAQGTGPIPGVAPAAASGAPVPGGPSASEQAFGPPRPPRPMLAQGSNGPSVMELQARLNAEGEALAVDGLFGPMTRAAVVRFQQAHGLAADGIVGPNTWGALDAQKPAPGAEPGAPVPEIPGLPPLGELPGLGDVPGGLLDPKPGQTKPSDAPPELGDLGGESDDLAVGDAEGNRDENTDLAGGPETLDRDGDATESLPGLGSAGNVFGFGGTPQPSRPAPVANAAKPVLLAGGFADRGQYKDSGDGFTDAELDSLLADYGTFWGVDVRELAHPDQPGVTAPGAGDSAGKGVATQPPWVKALQNKIIGRKKWDDDDRATQKLIEAYLRRFARDQDGLPPGAEQLFHQIGASETNGQADALGGYKGGSNWCAQASHVGLLLGMYNRGIRFKTDTHSNDYNVELTKQVTAYSKWTKGAGHVVSKQAAWTAQLEPGDIISVINGGATGPLSGHVATVVEHDGDRIVYVSGNAAGVVAFDGAVRIEEVKREQPPSDYDWSASAGRENTFQKHKREEKQHRDAWRADMDAMAIDQQTIETNLPNVQFPPLEYNVHSSVATYCGVAMANSKDAASPLAVQAACADMMFRANRSNSELGDAEASAAKRDAMMTDGGLPVSRDDKRFKPGVHAPATPGTSWVVEVIKASALTTAQVLASGATKTVPNDPALESGPTLAEQCPNAPAQVINQQATK